MSRHEPKRWTCFRSVATGGSISQAGEGCQTTPPVSGLDVHCSRLAQQGLELWSMCPSGVGRLPRCVNSTSKLGCPLLLRARQWIAQGPVITLGCCARYASYCLAYYGLIVENERLQESLILTKNLTAE